MCHGEPRHPSKTHAYVYTRIFCKAKDVEEDQLSGLHGSLAQNLLHMYSDLTLRSAARGIYRSKRAGWLSFGVGGHKLPCSIRKYRQSKSQSAGLSIYKMWLTAELGSQACARRPRVFILTPPLRHGKKRVKNESWFHSSSTPTYSWH